jgi:fucose permease
VVFAMSANVVYAALLHASVDFGVTETGLALTSSLQFVGFFLASIGGGIVADRLGRKAVLVTAAGLLALGGLLWAVAPRVVFAFGGGFVMGMGGGSLECVCSAVLSELYPTRRKFVLNMSQVAYCAGAVGLPAVMGLLIPAGISWRWFFVLTSLASVAVMSLFATARVPRPTHVAEDLVALPLLRQFSRLSVWLPSVLLFLYVLGETALITFSSTYLYRRMAAPEEWAVLSISFFWTAVMLGRLVCAFIPERFPYELAIGGLLSGSVVMLLLQPFASSWGVSLVLYVLTGLCFAGVWPLIVGMVAARHAGSGAVVGFAIALGSIGCIAAAPVFGTAFATRAPVLAFGGVALCMALGVLLCLHLFVSERRAPEAVRSSL